MSDALKATIESATGGKVTLAGEVIVGRGKTRATLHGGEPVLVSVTAHGSSWDALLALAARLDCLAR